MSKDARGLIGEFPIAIQIYDKFPEKFVPYNGALNIICTREDKMNIISYDSRGIFDMPCDIPALKELIKENKKKGISIEETLTKVVEEFDDFIDSNFDEDENYIGISNPFNIFVKNYGDRTVDLFVPESAANDFVRKNSKRQFPPLRYRADKKQPEKDVGAVQLASDYDEQSEFREELVSPDSRKVVDWEVRHVGTATVYKPVYEKVEP